VRSIPLTPSDRHSPARRPELLDPAKHQQEEELEALLGERDKLEVEARALKQELSKQKSLREQSESDYLNLQQNNVDLEGQVKTLTAAVTDFTAKEHSITAREIGLQQNESRNKEEANRLAALSEALSPREELERANRTLRTSNTRLSNEKAMLLNANKTQAERVDRHKADKEKLRDQLHGATDDLDRVLDETKGLKSRLTRVERELDVALQQTNREMFIRGFESVRWIVESGVENHGLLFPKAICTHGSGPWDVDELDGLLQDIGFELFNCGDYDETRKVGIIVVGSDEWDREAIEAQINNREGKSVKVFTQELFVAALACGCDPFELIPDDDDPDIPEFLESFGRDHPVIQYLRSLDFPWPIFGYADKPPRICTDWEVDESPLFLAGYTVKEKEGLLQSERRSVLSGAFKEDLIWVHSDAYMNSWGNPLKLKRLRRIAYHIAMLTRRHSHHTKAVIRWKNDLDWLREQYYKPMLRRFKWPVMR